MKVLADISVIPLGGELSLSPYIAACERVLTEAGLQPTLHAFALSVDGTVPHSGQRSGEVRRS